MDHLGHVIKISNYHPSENVTYSLILIKGSVQNQNCKKYDQRIIINNEQYPIGPENTFKAIIPLKEGSNRIIFHYCCEEEILHLVCNTKNSGRRSVQPLYVIFREHDGSFQAPKGMENEKNIGLAKVQLNCQLIQTIVAEKLYEARLKHHTFHLDPAAFFYSKIHIDEARCTPAEVLFHKLAVEIQQSLFGSPFIKHIAFLSGTFYNGDYYKDGMQHDELIQLTNIYIALGVGGLAAFHTACFYSWPCELSEVIPAFSNVTQVNKKELLDDSNYRTTWGACYSTTLGAVLHELCHTFDLGHASHGIMSRGFDDVRDIFLLDSPEAVEADRRRGSHGITDTTKLHKSGAFILRYHKWILNETQELPFTLNFDNTYKFIKSSFGIRVIEIRVGDEQTMQRNWTYPIPKMSLQLDLSGLPPNATIFIMDNKGNVIQSVLE